MTPSAPRSLTALPAELLLEIVSHHTSFDSLTSLERLDRFDNEQRQVRRQVLLSLSQSCSALRAVFIRPLWERVDISRPNFHDADIRNELATRIFPYIKYVHVSLRLWSPKKTKQFKLLVEFLLALPNLISLRIRWQLQFKVGLQGRGDSKLFSAFADVSLPSVTSLSVSDNLHPIFHAFPNITTLACPSILAGSDALRPAIECFPYLDALVGLRIYRHTVGQKLEFDALSIAGQYPWISTRQHTHPPQNSHAISRACACCASRIPYHAVTSCNPASRSSEPSPISASSRFSPGATKTSFRSRCCSHAAWTS
ncbi:hypothetical protein B0H14DRAFT_2661431 [Mycena olivaceomarginata]|nr:hypothetical protein B0H14DRAFT_2661431 [Mycena olivaceomarginata]